MQITYDEFTKVDIRVGKIIQVDDFPEARKSAYKLMVDFGSEVGIKRSSAQIVHHYKKDELAGKLVMGVVNFPIKQIGPFFSESLTLGFTDKAGFVVLAEPGKSVPLGSRLF